MELCRWQISGKYSPIKDFSVSCSIIFFQVTLLLAKKSMAPTTNKPSLALESATHIRFWSDKKPILFSSLFRTKESKMILLSSPWKLSTTVTRILWSKGYCFLSWKDKTKIRLDWIRIDNSSLQTLRPFLEKEDHI